MIPVSATRRSALLGAAGLAACAPQNKISAAGSAAISPGPDLSAQLAAFEQRLQGGRLGLCAIETDSRKKITHRADERFAMASTFKWLLAAAILKRSEAGLPLDQRVLFSKADLLDHAPVTKAHVAEGSLSIEQLSEAAVEVSDNTAANLILPAVMGPQGLTRFLRENGDGATRLDRTEPTLNENAPGDARDSTTPAAMAGTLERFLLGPPPGDVTPPLLSGPSRDKLIGWLEKATPGLGRLRAGLPKDWRCGDKSGAGQNGAVNDCCIATPPNRKPIVIACYMSEGAADTKAREVIQAEIGALIAKTWG